MLPPISSVIVNTSLWLNVLLDMKGMQGCQHSRQRQEDHADAAVLPRCRRKDARYPSPIVMRNRLVQRLNRRKTQSRF